MRYLLSLFSIFTTIFLYAQPYIAREKALADIDAYHKALFDIHYNPYQYISKEEYAKKAEVIKKSIPDSIEFKAFVNTMFKLMALLDDGHNMPFFMQWPVQDEWQKKVVYPIPMRIDEKGELYVSAHSKTKDIPAGAQVHAVNGINLKQFVQERLNYLGGLENYKKNFIVQQLPFHLYMNGLKLPYKVKYTHNGRRQEAVINEGIDLQSSFSLNMPNGDNGSITFKILNQKLGYFDFRMMNGNFDKFRGYLDSCFAVMHSQNIQNLAIDIRNNPGGNSNFGDLLLQYITERPSPSICGKYMKVSQQYKDYLKWAYRDSTSEYHKKEVGTIWKRDAWVSKRTISSEKVFRGKVYLLIGPGVFSSANLMADGAKHNKLATLVGEPTGERVNDFGEVCDIELPNSKMIVNITTSYFVGADCDLNYKGSVTPHIYIKSSGNGKLKGIDPVLEYVIKQSNKQKAGEVDTK